MEERCQLGAEACMLAPDGRRVSIFAAKLLAGGGQRAVRVWAEAGGETYAIGTLSPEKPQVLVPCVVLRGEFVLRHDSVDANVRIYYRFLSDRGRAPAARLIEPTVVGGVELEPLDEDDDDDDSELEDSDGELDLTMTEFYDLGPPPRDGEEEHQADSEDEDEWGEEYDLPSEEDDAEHYDSDNGDDGEPRKGRDNGDAAAGESSRSATAAVAAPAGIFVPDGEFLGPARFAAVENTAGFMRVAAAGGEEGGDKEILVLYRYTRFSKTWSGGRGVEACRRTKLHWVRFAVPAAGDMATSLAWAGSSLGPLIYPALFRRQLHELWSGLAAPVMNTVPPHAARLQVIVDVGILRREDHTPERMAHMRGEMEAKMREAWPEYYHVGMELGLPEPVPDDEEQGESARTAKRRKVAADDEEDEECSVCFDPLDSGLAAWPGCRHVFHGACVEKTLAGSEMCPLCRKKLSDQDVC